MALYGVPLVSANLQQQEMILQMVKTLEYLDRLSNDMLTKVAFRVRENRQRINNIQSRVEAANIKINTIAGSKKATKVFSSSNFPASLNSHTIGVFNGSLLTMKEPELKSQVSNVKVEANVVFYPTHNQTTLKPHFPLLPKTVSEVLIFNCEELAFWEQPASERSSKSHFKRKHDEIDSSADNLLGEAPWSISHREPLDRTSCANFSYIPGLGDVPELNLPLALPDLPGIADDLAYNEDMGPGIAPSLMAALPDIAVLTESVVNIQSPMPPPPPPVSLRQPSPEPLRPVSKPVLSSTPLAPVGLPPPPPPPLPPVDFQPAPSAVTSSPEPPLRPKPPAGDDMRANLMAAIREAGGAGKLKSSARVKHTQAVKEHQEQVAVTKGKAATSNPAGDLMTDLFNKLSMRRKGISGQNSEGAGSSSKPEGRDPMDRISQMIPPPPSPGANNPSSDELDDWK